MDNRIKEGTRLRAATPFQDKDWIVVQSNGTILQLNKGGIIYPGELVYERVGIVVREMDEIESAEDEPIVVGYKYGDAQRFDVLAVQEGWVWVRCTYDAAPRPLSGRTVFFTTKVENIPRRKIKRCVPITKIVKE